MRPQLPDHVGTKGNGWNLTWGEAVFAAEAGEGRFRRSEGRQKAVEGGKSSGSKMTGLGESRLPLTQLGRPGVILPVGGNIRSATGICSKRRLKDEASGGQSRSHS